MTLISHLFSRTLFESGDYCPVKGCHDGENPEQ